MRARARPHRASSRPHEPGASPSRPGSPSRTTSARRHRGGARRAWSDIGRGPAASWRRSMLGSVLRLARRHAEGDFDRARELGRRAAFHLARCGAAGHERVFGMGQSDGSSAGQATRRRRSVCCVRRSRMLEALGDRGYYPTTAVAARRVPVSPRVLRCGIEALCARARETTEPADDIVNFVWLDVRRRSAPRSAGRSRTGGRASRASAVSASRRRPTTFLHRSFSWAYLAEAHALGWQAGRSGCSRATAPRSLDAKGDVAGAARFRARLAELGVEFP